MSAAGERIDSYLSAAQCVDLLQRSRKYLWRDRPCVRIVRSEPARPLVSIVIATYNWSRVLGLAIRSVLWQTEQNFELLVIGDGCTDDSEQIVLSFGDARIRWHNLPSNSGGQSVPNNVGLAMARGKYIAYLGHDDIWHPEHLRQMIEAARGADVASSLVEMIGPADTNFRVVTGIYPDTGYHEFCFVPPSGLLHPTEVEARWPDYRTVSRNPDVEFVHRLWESGGRFASTRELTVYKFNSALRKNSYVDKPFQEQAAYLRRIGSNPWFMRQEAWAIAQVHLQGLPMTMPAFEPPPCDDAKGWYVTQYRKYRGLE